MFSRHRIRKNEQQARRLRMEALEDRRMLTTPADVVFLVDESRSVSATAISMPMRRRP
jgi:hypothetical protein